jgi:NAD(P)-dependent dehydrogenase (short-subunit alcohol dehydrogenase family)
MMERLHGRVAVITGAASGLGLAMARDVARSHGGDIRIGEGPLGGARVVARLVVETDDGGTAAARR